MENRPPDTPEQNELAPVSADVDDIAAATAESASAPNEAAMFALTEQQLAEVPVVRTVTTETAGEPRDAKGNLFDPAAHHTNPDGTPKLYNGKLRRKKATKAETESTVGARTAGTPELKSPSTPPQLTATEKAAARASGSQAADFIIMAAQAIGGEEFTPIINGAFESSGADGMPEYNERKLLREAMSDLAEYHGVTKFSPAWGVLLAFGLYVGLRFRMPKTRGKWQTAKAWIYSKVGSILGRRRAARSDSRNDNEREKHAGADAGASGTTRGT